MIAPPGQPFVIQGQPVVGTGNPPLQAGDTVKHHAAAIASIAGWGAGLHRLHGRHRGAGSIGCAAGAVGNLVSYVLSCRSSATGCSLAGAVITTGLGALAGAAGGALSEVTGGLTGSLLGDALPGVQRVIMGVAARGGAGGVAGAGGYAASSSGCSWSGFARATVTTAAIGGLTGGLLEAAGGTLGGLGRGLTVSCGGSSPVPMRGPESRSRTETSTIPSCENS